MRKSDLVATLLTGQASAIDQGVAAAQLEAASREVANLADALDHIRRVCENARQSTRRIRWIIERAKSALAGDDKWKDVEIPRHDPAIEKLENMIVAIYPIAKLELAARRELYEGDDTEIPDATIRSEVAILARFVREAPHVSAAIRQAEGV